MNEPNKKEPCGGKAQDSIRYVSEDEQGDNSIFCGGVELIYSSNAYINDPFHICNSGSDRVVRRNSVNNAQHIP